MHRVALLGDQANQPLPLWEGVCLRRNVFNVARGRVVMLLLLLDRREGPHGCCWCCCCYGVDTAAVTLVKSREHNVALVVSRCRCRARTLWLWRGAANIHINMRGCTTDSNGGKPPAEQRVCYQALRLGVLASFTLNLRLRGLAFLARLIYWRLANFSEGTCETGKTVPNRYRTMG